MTVPDPEAGHMERSLGDSSCLALCNTVSHIHDGVLAFTLLPRQGLVGVLPGAAQPQHPPQVRATIKMGRAWPRSNGHKTPHHPAGCRLPVAFTCSTTVRGQLCLLPPAEGVSPPCSSRTEVLEPSLGSPVCPFWWTSLSQPLQLGPEPFGIDGRGVAGSPPLSPPCPMPQPPGAHRLPFSLPKAPPAPGATLAATWQTESLRRRRQIMLTAVPQRLARRAAGTG